MGIPPRPMQHRLDRFFSYDPDIPERHRGELAVGPPSVLALPRARSGTVRNLVRPGAQRASVSRPFRCPDGRGGWEIRAGWESRGAILSAF